MYLVRRATHSQSEIGDKMDEKTSLIHGSGRIRFSTINNDSPNMKQFYLKSRVVITQKKTNKTKGMLWKNWYCTIVGGYLKKRHGVRHNFKDITGFVRSSIHHAVLSFSLCLCELWRVGKYSTKMSGWSQSMGAALALARSMSLVRSMNSVCATRDFQPSGKKRNGFPLATIEIYL